MKLNDREKKLLLLLAVVAIIFLVSYLFIPQIRNINLLKNEISTNEILLSSFETRRDVLQGEYLSKQTELDLLKEELSSNESTLGSVKMYKSITNGEIIVELNKFIPFSPTDKFIIEEISFLSNETEDTVEGEETSTTTEEASTGTNTTTEETTTETDATTVETDTTDTENTNSIGADDKQYYDDIGVSTEGGLNSGNSEDIFADYGFEQNLTAVKFTGYYSSLVKFVENLTGNSNYVVLLSLQIENVALNDPTVSENLISGEMLIAFPTYEGASDDANIYAILDDLYEQSTNDPFGPYDGFVIVDESEDYDTETGNNFIIDDNGNIINIGEDTGVIEDEVEFKIIESFNKNKFFYVSNDNRNGGYVSTSQKSTDGNASLKIYYDFYNRNNKNIAYAVSESENMILDSTPQEILIDVFNDSSNENRFGVVFRDATGNESETIILDNLDFNGWSTCTIPLPDNMVYPVVMQRFYIQSDGSGIKQEGTVLLDNLRIIEYK